MFEHLPDEVNLFILRKLSPSSLKYSALVNQLGFRLTKEPTIWREKVKKEFGESVPQRCPPQRYYQILITHYYDDISKILVYLEALKIIEKKYPDEHCLAAKKGTSKPLSEILQKEFDDLNEIFSKNDNESIKEIRKKFLNQLDVAQIEKDVVRFTSSFSTNAALLPPHDLLFAILATRSKFLLIKEKEFILGLAKELPKEELNHLLIHAILIFNYPFVKTLLEIEINVDQYELIDFVEYKALVFPLPAILVGLFNQLLKYEDRLDIDLKDISACKQMVELLIAKKADINRLAIGHKSFADCIKHYKRNDGFTCLDICNDILNIFNNVNNSHKKIMQLKEVILDIKNILEKHFLEISYDHLRPSIASLTM